MERESERVHIVIYHLGLKQSNIDEITVYYVIRER